MTPTTGQRSYTIALMYSTLVIVRLADSCHMYIQSCTRSLRNNLDYFCMTPCDGGREEVTASERKRRGVGRRED